MKSEKPRILVVDDEEIVRESLTDWLAEEGCAVEAVPDGAAAIRRVGEEAWAVLLVDLKMPGIDGLQVLAEARRLQSEATVVIMTAYASVDTAVQAMKLGAYDYLVKPFEPEELSHMVRKILAQQALRQENIALRKALKRQYRFHELVSKSPRMQAIFEVARSAAASHSTVLLLGESGTGKELLARAIHAESPRAEGPFVAVSCAALTETLLEGELFGHEKGAFTGATATRKGKVELAHGGTLFLDEIGDISPKLQLDLLRFLEQHEFRRVGGTEVIRVDARIIAATNRDLRQAVADGRFREDLFYRLNVIPILLPPLRDRTEDIPMLVEHFLELLRAETGKPIEGVTREALGALMARPWPGNVRELRNLLERGVVLSRGPYITAADLELLPAPGAPGEAPVSLREAERRHIQIVLGRCGWNVTRAARALGIDRVTLHRKMEKYSLRPAAPS